MEDLLEALTWNCPVAAEICITISSHEEEMYMARTLLDIDEDALAAAMAELGTKTKVATVNAALREVADRRTRVRLLDDLDVSDLDDPDVMSGAWR